MNTTSACPAHASLQEYLLGRLSETTAADVEKHLASCSECRKRLPTIRAEDDFVADFRAQAGRSQPENILLERLASDLRNQFQDPSAFQATPQPADGEATPAHPGFVANDPEELRALLAPPREPDELGRLGDYRVLKVLGSGGMGVVFLAEDIRLRRRVALKVMKPALASSARARQRFLREAQLMASLSHDHIVAIHQVGEEKGVPFLAMPLLQGESLDARLKREGRLPLAEVLRIGREAAEGLAAAHERGLIHRDVKPANLWLETLPGERGTSTPRYRVKVLDFGLARSSDGDAQLTQSGDILGTPAYMAPEQVDGRVDNRADLFSLGCVLYRMIVGESPFPGETPLQVLAQIALVQPRLPRDLNPETPLALSDLVMRMLAKKPGDRPETAREVAQALAVLERGLWAREETATIPDAKSAAKLPRRRRIWWAALSAAALLGASLAAFVLVRIVTDKGDLVIEADDAVEVTLKQGGKQVQVLDTRTNRKFAIAAGEYDAEVTEIPDGVRVATKHFTLTRGGLEVLTVRLEPKPAVQKSVEAPVVAVANADRRAAEWVLQIGGGLRITTPDQGDVPIKAAGDLPAKDGFRVVAINLEGNAKVDDAGLENLAGLTALEELYLGYTGVTDAGIRRLEGLMSLRKLSLLHTPISSAAAASIARLKRLQFLDLFETDIGDDALAHLATLPDLREFMLQRTSITDAGLKHLSHMTSLRLLTLGDRPLSDAGLEVLNGLTELEKLDLNGTDIVGTGVGHLEGLSKLRELILSCGRLTDEGLASLPQWPNLEILDINSTAITGEGVKSLARFKQLRRVDLAATLTTEEDARRLKAELPQCEIRPGWILTTNPLDQYQAGKWVRFFSSEKDANGLEHCRFNQGVLEVTSDIVGIRSVDGPNYILRAKAKLGGANSCALVVRKSGQRHYFFDLFPDGRLQLGKSVNGEITLLAWGRCPAPGDNFAELTFLVQDGKLTGVVAQASGFVRLDAEDTGLSEGVPGLEADNGAAQFKDVEVQNLDQKAAFETWLKAVAAMKPEEQVQAVAKKLQELNPDFDGKVTPTIEGGAVTGLEFLTDHVTDISPVRALVELQTLDCAGTAINYQYNGRLSDLSPLKDMKLMSLSCPFTQVSDLSPLKTLKLTFLDCGGTQVSNLSPLQAMPLAVLHCGHTQVFDLSPLKDLKLTELYCGGTPVGDLSALKAMPLATLHCEWSEVSDLLPLMGMPLTHLRCERTKASDLSPLKGMPLQSLYCDFKPERDADILRSIKTLETINDKSAADFWKEAPAGANPPVDDAWLKKVAALAADKQVEAVAAELKARNPGFDGKVTPKIENGVVTAVEFLTDNVTDLSPVRALIGLQRLKCGGAWGGKGRLADLSPLKDMKLTSLDCSWSQVLDLSPLKDMKLTSLDCGGDPVSDLTPLQGMPLTELHCGRTQVFDLSPLKGMKLTVLGCENTKVTDLSPLKEIGPKVLLCDVKSRRDIEILRSIGALERINGILVKDFWKEAADPTPDTKP